METKPTEAGFSTLFFPKFGLDNGEPFKPHPKFVEFLHQQSLRNFSNVTFHFDDKPFIFIIGWFSDLSDEVNYEKDKFIFGVNDDGYNLLLDVNDDSLQIIQDEVDRRFELGITIYDLLNATIENP